ncbi:helix-turn-helix domain-containing protein [Chitinophaga sp. YIM B06452]|uniref:helix-turn-helix domain-containing protein n=1 Tax=Chitinophaga sp. YIM B06452 TaxID=3082158 RepID=UPI0031FEA1FB
MDRSTITQYSFRKNLPSEFEIIDLSSLYEQHGDKLASPHRTAFYHIIWHQDKSTNPKVDFKPIRVHSNSLLFLKKGIVQQFNNVKAKGKALLFTEEFVARHPEALTFLKSTILFNDLLETAQLRLSAGDLTIPRVFEAIEGEFARDPDHFQPGVLLNYLHILLQVSERMYRKEGFREIKKSADLDYTLLFRDELESHYKTIRQVSQYAKLLSVTEKRLNAATARILGKPPKEIIDERVMLEGKRLLAHTWLSVKEIGYSLGFDEPTNFIKYFRKHSGKTPIEFREQFSK